jgi:hypothetical protein
MARDGNVVINLATGLADLERVTVTFPVGAVLCDNGSTKGHRH